MAQLRIRNFFNAKELENRLTKLLTTKMDQSILVCYKTEVGPVRNED